MIAFEHYEGPFGIPIYFQKLPDVVKPVSVRWLVFVGSADDESVGSHGIYHWFEHAPFRGTKNFPDGYSATQGRFARYGGNVGAHTAQEHTSFHAFVPKRLWKEAISLITDLMAQPLLTDEGITAERQIIREELTAGISEAAGYAHYHVPKILFPHHPLGHSVIGSEETLYSMDASILRKAWEAGYDRSRCVLIVAGDIDKAELHNEICKPISNLPSRLLSERRVPASYGQLPPWQKGKTTELETPFATSVIFQFFPTPPISL